MCLATLSANDDFPTKSNTHSSVENLSLFEDDEVNVETVDKMNVMSDSNENHCKMKVPIPPHPMVPPALSLIIPPTPTPTPLMILPSLNI